MPSITVNDKSITEKIDNEAGNIIKFYPVFDSHRLIATLNPSLISRGEGH